MADNATKKLSYFNTLIFTIISGLISLILLALLFFKIGDNYILAIILIEVGIFSVIGYCIYQIIHNEFLINQLKNSDNVLISFDKCPDYFLSKIDNNGNTYCSNEYIYEDAAMNKFVIKLYPEGQTPPTQHNPTKLDKLSGTTMAPEGPIDKFYINDINNNNTLKTNEDKCAPIFKDSTDPNGVHGYAQLPWTYLKSQCESYQYQ